mgnify:CR=1 FL=1
MGLYKKITDKYLEPVHPQQAAGLYNKALLYYVPLQESKENSFFFDYPFIEFSRICGNKFPSIAVLLQNNFTYQSCFLSGFNDETNTSLTSSKDFWDGTIPDYDWHIFSQDELSPFYQLFSNTDKNNLQTLYIKKSLVNTDISYIYILNTSTVFNPESFELLFLKLKEYL